MKYGYRLLGRVKEPGKCHPGQGQIGFERIRVLAVSRLLLGTSEQKNSTDANRGIGALSSGWFAAEMCRRGVPVDPELAFLCSALRSYGRIRTQLTKIGPLLTESGPAAAQTNF